MGNYYEKVKDSVKIVEALESSDTDDESRHALKKLRPKLVKKAKQNGKEAKLQEVIKDEEQLIDDMKYEKRNYSPITMVM
jgi:hypothetical protein